MGLSDERYMLLTTYRRDGRAVATPVWLAKLDSGDVGFWTTSSTGKIKRLRHTARVTVQASDARGNVKPGTAPLETTARIVTGSELAEITARVKAKYGIQARITGVLIPLMMRLRGRKIDYADTGVVVHLEPDAG